MPHHHPAYVYMFMGGDIRVFLWLAMMDEDKFWLRKSGQPSALTSSIPTLTKGFSSILKQEIPMSLQSETWFVD